MVGKVLLTVSALFTRFDRWLLIEGVLLLLVAPFLIFPSVVLPVTIVGILLIVALWAGKWVLLRQPLVPSTPFNAPLLLLAVMIGVGAFVTTEWSLTLPKVTNLFLGYAAWLFFVRFAVSAETQRISTYILLLLGIGLTLLGAVSADWHFEIGFVERIFQTLPTQLLRLPESPLAGTHTNQLGGTIIIIIPVLLVMFLRERDNHCLLSWLLLIALIFECGLLLLTQSRSAWIGFLAGMTFLTYVWLRNKMSIAIQLGIGIAFLALIIVGGWLFIRSDTTSLPNETAVGTLSTVAVRQEVWEWGTVAIGDFPLTGVGLGTFRQVMHRFYPTTLPFEYDFAHAHNIFFQVALDVGLIGLVAYLTLLGLGLMVAMRVESNQHWLALGLFAGIFALHIFGLMDALPLGSKPSLLFWVALGILAGLQRSNNNVSSRERTAILET